MSLIQTAIFALIEGITEFLPVSSTAHLVLTSEVLGIHQTDAHKSFEIAIQLGAIFAVVMLYARDVWRNPRLILLAIVGFVPTAVIGFLLYDVVKDMLVGSIPIVLWSLFLGGVVLIVFEYLRPVRGGGDVARMTVAQALLVGTFQSLSIVPGVSRSAATIVGGELLSVGRKTIVEFSFLLAIPTMAAATGYDLWKTAGEFSSADVRTLIIGFILSFLFALIAVRWFLEYVKRHSFAVFGVYRIALALVFWAWLHG